MSDHYPPGALLCVQVGRWSVWSNYKGRRGSTVKYWFELGMVNMTCLCWSALWGNSMYYTSWLRSFHHLEDFRGPGILDFIPPSMRMIPEVDMLSNW